jgi:hypothetical protein
MPDDRRVTLSKAHRETPVGRELIQILTELSADGNVSREEMERLRGWLEVDHGVAFPALPFLHETIEQISSDGEVTEDELDRLALAIERVLPIEIRFIAADKRKRAREARRVAQREARRQEMITGRAERKGVRDAARLRAGVLYKAEFAVTGAFRSEERREACERLMDGDAVTLEREPDNVHDSNAVLILGHDDCELGYVPRVEARKIARLLDAGAEPDAVVQRLWETPEDHHVVPILLVKVRRGSAEASIAEPSRSRPAFEAAPHKSAPPKSTANVTEPAKQRGRGCGTVLLFTALLFLVFLILLVAAIVVRS